MSPSLVRGYTLVSLGLILTSFTASCSRPSGNNFRNVELTKEEIISLYDVPVEKKPFHKFEWNFATPHYVRWVVERRDSPTEEWKSLNAWAFGMACEQAFLIERLDDDRRELAANKEGNLILTIRLGGSRSRLSVFKNSGWSGSTLALPLPQTEFRTESHLTDPEKILLITSGPRSYRLRMEASEKPYAAN